MKAAVLNEQPGSLVIEDLHIDDPAPGEVLVRTVAAGLCHSDLHFMENLFRTPVPAVMGHESAGVVENVGDGVSYVAPGDHVICCLSVFCGQCRQCLSGHPYRCSSQELTSRRKGSPARIVRDDGTAVQQFARLGGFAERMLVHQNGLVKIRPDVPFDKVALLGCGVLTGSGAVFRTAGVRSGERVCVIGAGGIGLSAVQAARIVGAGQVIVVDVSDQKLDVARKLGATDVVNAKSVDDVVAEVKRLSGGGVDYSFEAIGLKETAEQAYRMTDVGGTATVIGMVPSSVRIEIRGADLLSERKLQGSMMGSNQFRQDIPNLIDMYLDGRLLLDEMVSGHIGLDDVNDGYAAMKRGEVTRTVIDFDD